MRKSLAGLVLLFGLLALPATAGAVLSGTNGRIAYIDGPAFGNTQLFLRSVTSSTGAGTSTGPLATGLTFQHRHPTWSPDRTHIAFAEGPGSDFDIYTLDLTDPGAKAVDITNSPGITDDRPAWSPDGTRIAYESGPDIVVQSVTGAGTANLTGNLTPKAWKAAWSPDSQTLYYSVGDITLPPNGTNNDIRLYQQPADGSSAGTELLHNSGAHVFQPSISPDGTKLCYTLSLAAGNSTTASVVAAPLSNPSSITIIESSGAGDYNCTWSPDGTKIAYTENYGGEGEIYMKAADGTGIPFDLSNTPGQFDGNADWAPDGRPTCPDTAVTTNVNTAVTFKDGCTDTGPAYEQTEVRETAVTQPSHGTLKQESADEPFVYTPNAGFTGKDSFEVVSFDEFGFGSDTGTVTITVEAPKKTGGGGKKGGGKGKGGKGSAFGAKTQVTIGLAARRIPARGPVKVVVTNKNKFAITGKLSGKHARVKLRARRFAIKARAKATVRLKLPKPLQRVLRRKHVLKIRLTAVVKDPAGNSRTVTKTVKPKLKT